VPNFVVKVAFLLVKTAARVKKDQKRPVIVRMHERPDARREVHVTDEIVLSFSEFFQFK
jgi:hypothetical protein